MRAKKRHHVRSGRIENVQKGAMKGVENGDVLDILQSLVAF